MNPLVRFTIRFISIVVILMFGILIGMNMAEKGIYRVAGNPNLPTDSLNIAQKNQQVEVKVLGKTYTTTIPKTTKTEKDTSPKEKEESTQKVPSSNQMSLLSKVGNALSITLQKGAEKGLEILANFIHNS